MTAFGARAELQMQRSWIECLQSAMTYVLNSPSIPDEHRPTLRRALLESAHVARDAELEMSLCVNDGAKWNDADIAVIVGTLRDAGIPGDYGAASSLLECIANRLQRSEKAVKKKMVELGLTRYISVWHHFYATENTDFPLPSLGDVIETMKQAQRSGTTESK